MCLQHDCSIVYVYFLHVCLYCTCMFVSWIYFASWLMYFQHVYSMCILRMPFSKASYLKHIYFMTDVFSGCLVHMHISLCVFMYYFMFYIYDSSFACITPYCIFMCMWLTSYVSCAYFMLYALHVCFMLRVYSFVCLIIYALCIFTYVNSCLMWIHVYHSCATCMPHDLSEFKCMFMLYIHIYAL